MFIRLFTENKNYNQVRDIVKQHFEAFSMFTGNGYWQGIQENCLVVEIDYENSYGADEQHRIEKVCYEIKKLNNQQAILVQQIEAYSHFL